MSFQFPVLPIVIALALWGAPMICFGCGMLMKGKRFARANLALFAIYHFILLGSIAVFVASDAADVSLPMAIESISQSFLLFAAPAGPFLGVFFVMRAIFMPATHRRMPNVCDGCGYNLTGNESGTCPECGKTITVPVRRV
jgi:hypothetical protein